MKKTIAAGLTITGALVAAVSLGCDSQRHRPLLIARRRAVEVPLPSTRPTSPTRAPTRTSLSAQGW